MKHERVTGLIAMAFFGPLAAACYIHGAYFPNEASGLELTFGLFICGFAFLIGLVQFITGEVYESAGDA